MTAVACDLNLGEARKAIVQPVPEPHGDALERRRFKSLDLVEKAMIEDFPRIGDGGFKIIEMEQDTRLRIRLAVDSDAGAERVAVHPRIGMSGRRRRQQMSRLEEEVLVDPHGQSFRGFSGVKPGLGGELAQAEKLVGLEAQAPFRMGEAIVDGRAEVAWASPPGIHGLEQEMREVEVLER